ncbi:uncharacterized protein LOC109835565 [Asparagus officinalis]|uniref:uncharacterized protein LOC109835565 n=1 Tax=Asparagus officinalis TaxID=4686 RepID=UPI00098E663C|nr:uncharacterized protein LOC109835565 [Asparagus officinalis]
MQPNFQMPYMMQPNFGMQYPYLPYGYQPSPGNSYVPSHMNVPNPESSQPTTPRFSSGSTDIPDFSTQVSLGNVGGDTPHSFLPPTQQSVKKTTYDTWSTEDNILLLTGYFHVSNDSELGNNKKGDTFWGKIKDYVNENSNSGEKRTVARCQSHFRDINRKISSFVGCYSTACRERRSGWSDKNYISKVVRNQPRYMTGTNASGSSGSKRKSSGEDVESSIPTLVRPEGRDARKKKVRASSSKSSTSRKSKVAIEDEFSNLASVRENYQQSMESTVSAMLEYAAGQKQAAYAKKLEVWMILKNKEDRDEEDEYVYNTLKKDLFDL